jgi:hypothetical protein
MKSRRRILSLIGIGLIIFACQPPPPSQDYSDEAELRNLELTARKILNLKLDKIERIGSEKNFLAIKSESILFSQRLDTRTYLVQDQRYGMTRRAGVFQGSDQELIGFCRDVLRRLKIPLSEIGEEKVLQENTQLAQFDSATGVIRLEDQQKGQRLVRFSRVIEGLPVFSSRVILGLTKDKQIGFMELHWPEIPKHIVTEAHRLKYKVEHGWRPPEQKGAIVESVQAGILHSAALGFLMDIYPVIRVIYMPENQGPGRKLTLHFDRDGKTVPFPRLFDIPCPEPEEQRGK